MLGQSELATLFDPRRRQGLQQGSYPALQPPPTTPNSAPPAKPAGAPRELNDAAPPRGGVATSAPAPQPAMTFAQMQASGMARPAPPAAMNPFIAPPGGPFVPPTAPPAPGAPGGGGTITPPRPEPPGGPPTGGGTPPGGGNVPPGPNTEPPPIAESPLNQNILQMLQQWLGQPSRYDNAAVKQSYDLLSRQIDDEYDLKKQQTDEELARRGIYDSTIAGGRLHDLNIGRRTAKEQLGDQLLREQALTQGEDMARALAASMGYNEAQFQHALSQRELGFRKEALTQSGLQYLLQILSQFGLTPSPMGGAGGGGGGYDVIPGPGEPPAPGGGPPIGGGEYPPPDYLSTRYSGIMPILTRGL